MHNRCLGEIFLVTNEGSGTGNSETFLPKEKHIMHNEIV
jgi:hypothetical protein